MSQLYQSIASFTDTTTSQTLLTAPSTGAIVMVSLHLHGGTNGVEFILGLYNGDTCVFQWGVMLASDDSLLDDTRRIIPAGYTLKATPGTGYAVGTVPARIWASAIAE